MALNIRRKLSPEIEAIPEVALAALARRFLIDPFSSDSGPALAGLSEEDLNALQTVARELNVSVEELHLANGELRSRVVDLLVDVLKRSSLSAAREKAAKEGLGSAGLLPVRQYAIRFNDLLSQFEDLGERRNHIEEVMRAPQVVEHISFPDGEAGIEGHSLFARSIAPSRGATFFQLVVASRRGSELGFQAAWRFYGDLIEWSTADKLSDILRRFVAKYGVDFSFGGSGPLRFVEHQTFDLPPNFRSNPGTEVRILHDKDSKSHSFIASMSVNIRDNKTASLSLAYVVDTTRYQQDVQRVSGRH